MLYGRTTRLVILVKNMYILYVSTRLVILTSNRLVILITTQLVILISSASDPDQGCIYFIGLECKVGNASFDIYIYLLTETIIPSARVYE